MHSRKFLCCLPVRLGVFVLSFLQLVCGGMLAAGLWMAIANERRSSALTRHQKISIWVVAIEMTLLAVVALFGFIGTIIKKRSFISLYKSVLTYFLGLSIVLGIYLLVFLFKNNKEIIDACIAGSTDQYVIKACNNIGFKWFALGFLIIIWLVQLYCIIIIARYDEQLQDEASGKRAMALSESSYKYSKTRNGSQEFLTTPAPAQYPYTDAQHSYGNSGV